MAKLENRMRSSKTSMTKLAEWSTCCLIYGNACPVKLKQDGKGGRRGSGGMVYWFGKQSSHARSPPFHSSPILLYSPGLCDDKFSLTDQLTSFPSDLCLLTYIYTYKYKIFSSNYSSFMEKTINNSSECKKCFFYM